MRATLWPRSIRQRLLLLLLIAAALLSVLLFVSVRAIASASVEATQDSILGAATIAIAEELRGGEDGVSVEIPYAAFSMLGSIGEDRVFYRILVNGETITGYGDLPLPATAAQGLEPVFFSRDFQGEPIRLAAVSRSVRVEGRFVEVGVVVGQTRSTQEAIVSRMASRAGVLGLGFFLLSVAVALVTARTVVRPLDTLAAAVSRRGPQDLRPVTRPVPDELRPLVGSLNGFISRLSGALSRTETFIAEAAHHIRTPLATLRTHAEIAQRKSDDPEVLDELRKIVRAVDSSSRSAGQLLDHATVAYRSDQRTDEALDLGQVLRELVAAVMPTAELKDLELALSLPPGAVVVQADRLLLESAVRNLLDNAIKYSDAEQTVAVTLSSGGGMARLDVSDRGRGLGAHSAKHLTRRFTRGDNVGEVIGSGLGLTIVREVARAQSGHFSIENREGGGTCATLSLPLA